MENSGEIVLKESDMLVKEIGIIKHDKSRVIAGQFGPKAPDKFKDRAFVAHVKAARDLTDTAKKMGAVKNQCIAVFETGVSGYMSAHMMNTRGDSLAVGNLVGNPLRDVQHATQQASAYVDMLNGMTKQEWERDVKYADVGYGDSLFAKNMLAGDNWIALTHRDDFKVSVPATDDDFNEYGGRNYYNRVYPKRAVTGRCVEVLNNAVIMDNIKGFGNATHVDMGFAVTDEEKALLQKTIEAKAPVQLAVSLDGKSLLVNAGELGKVVTKHNDVAIPKLFMETVPQIDRHYDDIRPEITGKLIHIHEGEKIMNGPDDVFTLEMKKKHDGEHKLFRLFIKDELIPSFKKMEGRPVTLSLKGNHLTGVRDLSREKKSKGLSL